MARLGAVRKNLWSFRTVLREESRQPEGAWFPEIPREYTRDDIARLTRFQISIDRNRFARYPLPILIA